VMENVREHFTINILQSQLEAHQTKQEGSHKKMRPIGSLLDKKLVTYVVRSQKRIFSSVS
jgi:hypothetical protein